MILGTIPFLNLQRQLKKGGMIQMEKTIEIDEQKIRFKTNGATPLRFKAQFGKDYFREILKLAPLESLTGKDKKEINFEDLEKLDFEVFYNISWIMAKTADPTIPEPLEWLEQFDEFPIADIIPELQDLMAASFQTSKKKTGLKEKAKKANA
jgi:hypothetical protein